MIIRNVFAENILKFTRLELTNLPETGGIAIKGANESGKSAVVESICLALFGRTFVLEAEHLQKAVKWDAHRGRVQVDFVGRDGQDYSVIRHLSADGEHEATLHPMGSEESLAQGVDGVAEAMVRLGGTDFNGYVDTFYLAQRPGGVQPIREETIKALAGVDVLENLADDLAGEITTAEENIATAQGERKTCQDRLGVLNVQEEALAELQARNAREKADESEQISQIDNLETFSVGLRNAGNGVSGSLLGLAACGEETTLDQWRGQINDLKAKKGALLSVIESGPAELPVTIGGELDSWLGGVEARVESGENLLEQVQTTREWLGWWLGEEGEEGLSEERDGLPRAAEVAPLEAEIKASQKSRGRSALATKLFLVLALIAWSGWGLLQFMPDFSLSQLLSQSLQTVLPAMAPGLLLMVAGGGLGLFTIMSLLKVFKFRGRIAKSEAALAVIEEQTQENENKVRVIDAASTQPLQKRVALLAKLENSPWANDLQQWSETDGRPLVNPEGRGQFRAKLGLLRGTFDGQNETCRKELAAGVASREGLLKEIRSRIAELDREIANEEARRAEDRSLRERIQALEEIIAQNKHDIEVRNLARHLLAETCLGMSETFNQELRRFISKSAPLFTGNRYQHLRIDDSMRVQAFSTRKDDFVHLEEVSTGARLQLMLAVRMALAQALVARSIEGQQFMILDEPFAFFDRQRFRQAVEALPGISDQLTQIWIVSQEFTSETDGAFARVIACDLEDESLVVAG
ncbi:MAG: hypothetical protein HQL52_13020 [Magnetococcales bacterium]|nr:hypothetical protein [Magnetococcales bacterium]